MDIKTTVTQAFKENYSAPPTFIVRAPGRVNLIGGSTDYNDGFVLPMAIEQAVWIAMRPRLDRLVRIRSLDMDQPADFDLDALGSRQGGWTDYPRGVAWALQDAGIPLHGWEGVLKSDVPIGAGLSSSAAIELATARAFHAAGPWEWDGPKIADLARRVENEYLGLKTGIMDQMISAMGRQGFAILLDARSLEIRQVPVPSEAAVIVLDTATRRGLRDSGYNERVAQCRAAAEALGVPKLRDVSLERLQDVGANLDPVLYKRARHVVTENQRVLQAAAAMEAGDAAQLGALISASHHSLRDDFENTTREIDLMVAQAEAQEGCLGARLIGGGFGGAALALVRTASVDNFVDQVGEAYQLETALTPAIYVCHSADGVETIELDG